MLFTDALTIDGTRVTETKLGYLAGIARVARGGNVQEYRGAELGRADLATVRVYRPEEEVFDEAAMHSFANLTMTDDHPRGELVDSKNWFQHARGMTGQKVVRDGDFVEVPYILMDAGAVSAVKSGKRELSMGYTSELVWGDGVSPKGERYDAKMVTIRGNHVAVVDKARGGPELKIGDQEPSMTTRKIIVDGVTYEMNDQTAEVVAKLQKSVTDAEAATSGVQAKLDAMTTKQAETQTALDKANAEKTALETKLKDASDPSKLADAAKAHSELCAKATAMVPGVKLDGLDGAGIRKAVVDAKVGEKAKGYNDATYAAAFDILADGVVVGDTLAAHFQTGGAGAPKVVSLDGLRAKAEAEHKKRNAEISGAWKGEEKAS
jgi:hypothetical protein